MSELTDLVLAKLLRTLSLDDAQTLCQDLVARYPLQDEYDEELLEFLAWINVIVPGATNPFLSDCITLGYTDISELFLGANEEVSRQFLALFDYSSARKNDLLITAAWIGNAEIQAQFQAWRQSPPDWRSDLYIPPEKYAHSAGWELTADGGRRDLYFSTCYELVAVEREDPFQMSEEEEASLLEVCGWCQRPLRRLIDLDLRDSRCHWISAEGERLSISVCPNCVYYETNYFDITLSGECCWSPQNGDFDSQFLHLDEDDVEWPAEPLHVSTDRKTPFEMSCDFIESRCGISQIGGHPKWIDDTKYPQCPSCQQTMMCLGQIVGDDWYESMEGAIYMFLCLPCKKAAANYQQT